MLSATKETVSVFEWPVTVWNRALKEAGTVLPKGTVRILDEAFRGTASGIVELPEGVTYIGQKAFADCRYLAEILIPAAAETIAADAFDGAWQLTVFGSADSAAETYALAHGFDFVPVK